MSQDAFANRIGKNLRRLGPWLKRHDISCFRAYDRDLPEVPLALDVYGTEDDGVHLCVHVFEPRHGIERGRLDAWVHAASGALGIPGTRVHVKRRLPGAAYEKQGTLGRQHVVREGGLRFVVNLDDYLDTGLFLDHRPTRTRVGRESAGRRVLNLFAYTGAFSVHAASGGARETVSVDLSPAYVRWAEENLVLNGHQGPAHRVIVDDVMAWVSRPIGQGAVARAGGGTFDLAIIDPPTLSRSKRAGPFEVQRDHAALIERVLGMLAPGGVIYFSTNFQGFSLHPPKVSVVDEITDESVPLDFPRRPPIHRAWRLRK